jgi:methionine sulfoxide reductase heme-binding subunit
MFDSVLWYATRGAGAVSLVLLTGVVLLGILSARRWRAAAWPRFLTTGFHRNLALLSVVFLGLHVVTAVIDPYTSLGWKAALVPFASPYRTFWLGLGVVAVDLLIALVITSVARRLIGLRGWRAIHWLAYACWPIALAHGLGTGSDTRYGWMLGLVVVCGAAAVAAAMWRLGGRRRQPATGSEGRPPPTWSRLAAITTDALLEARR